jgi:heme/copper-type cytochrome/quinol oxidase subunit 3
LLQTVRLEPLLAFQAFQFCAAPDFHSSSFVCDLFWHCVHLVWCVCFLCHVRGASTPRGLRFSV